jgi:hypothetical protein
LGTLRAKRKRMAYGNRIRRREAPYAFRFVECGHALGLWAHTLSRGYGGEWGHRVDREWAESGQAHSASPCHATSLWDCLSLRPVDSVLILPASSRRLMAPASAALETFSAFASRSLANFDGA